MKSHVNFAAPFSAIRDFVVLSDGSIVTTADIRTRDLIGKLIHVLDSEGNHVRSFGDRSPIVGVQARGTGHRLARSGMEGVFWAAHSTKYVIDQWTPKGVKNRRIERHATWFEPYDRIVIGSGTKPPQPLVMAIREDDAGLLWVVLRVPDPKWRDGLREVRGPVGQRGFAPTKLQDYVDTVVEVIDPVAGNLVARRRFDELAFWFADRNHLAVLEDFENDPIVHLWRLTLRR